MSDTNEINSDPVNEISTSNEDLDIVDSATISNKRRISSDEEWTEVKRKDKKLKDTEKIEIYISSKEKLPKQFSLAKLFKDQNIKDISRVKFLSPYRVRVELISEISAEKLETCEFFIDKGWNIYRAMEKNLSYGVIRDVDLEMSEENILENVYCPEPAKLVSVLRLNRKNFKEDGWSPSEAVRLCFKGPFLPPYVYTHGLRIKVEPYVFPVSQCSRCWKYGHIHKKCPSAKVVCPKCGKNHDNCETTNMICVNCKGGHISLSKTCPIFLKEKRLRELMSEFNCTYRKALNIYVPKDEPTHQPVFTAGKRQDIESDVQPGFQADDLGPTQTTNSQVYTKVTTKAQVHKQNEKPPFKQKQKKEDKSELEFMEWSRTEGEEYNDTERKKWNGSEEKQRDVSFKELLQRLQEIIFMKGSTIQMIFKGVIKTCIEWLILVVVDNVADWPILKLIIDYLSGGRHL